MAEHFDGSYGEASPFRLNRGGSSVLKGPHSLAAATSPVPGSSSQAPGPTPMEDDNTKRFRRKRNGQASGLSSKRVVEEDRCFHCYGKGHYGHEDPTFKDNLPRSQNNCG